MYITEKYWGNYIGDTDDSLNLTAYLSGKQKEEISLAEIFSDFGLNKLKDDFRQTDFPLAYTDPEGWEIPINYAIDLITDLAALLLECKVNGGIDLCELSGEDPEETAFLKLRITAASKEHDLIDRTLADFAADPLAFDLNEMCPEEDIKEMAALCEELRKELYCGQHDHEQPSY